jgi:hypothetical protein
LYYNEIKENKMNINTLQGEVINIGELNAVNPSCGADKVVVTSRRWVGWERYCWNMGFWGLVKCGVLIGWISCIPSIADGVGGVGVVGMVGDGFGPVCGIVV